MPVPDPFDPAGVSPDAFLAVVELVVLLVVVFFAAVVFFVAAFLAVVFFAAVFLAGVFFALELEDPVDVVLRVPVDPELTLLAGAGLDSAPVAVALDPVGRSLAGALPSPSGSGTSGTHGSAGGS